MKEIKNLLNIILEQNYIEHNGKWYKQNDGLAIGAPTSAILAEVFIRHLEHTIIVEILKKFQIIDYHRYVDDIPIIYIIPAHVTLIIPEKNSIKYIRKSSLK
jgi:hypothetical protein